MEEEEDEEEGGNRRLIEKEEQYGGDGKFHGKKMTAMVKRRVWENEDEAENGG